MCACQKCGERGIIIPIGCEGESSPFTSVRQRAAPWAESAGRKAAEKFASELADIICCALIIGANEGIDIEEAVCKCMLKNAKRAYGDGDKL